MKSKILTAIMITAAAILFIPFSAFSQSLNKHIPQPVISISGNEQHNPNSKMFTGDIDAVMNMEPYVMTYSDSIVTITDVFTGVTTFYDMQSNGVPEHLVQWFKDTLHAVFMWNMTPGIPAASRRCLYLVSTNTGLNWTSLGQVPNGISSGYPSVNLFDDGRAVIGVHAATGGLSAHSGIYHDIIPLGGTFTLCDPGYTTGNGVGVWVRFTTTASNKVPFVCSINSSTTNPSTYTNVLTNPMNCTFSGWMPYPDVDNAEQYAMARASNGKIGLVYITRGDIISSNAGDVKFMESTNEGLTWGTPVMIWDAQPNPFNFLGALRGIDLVYTGNTPKVVFDLVWQTDAGSYYPGLCSKIMFWSPNVNGGVPLVVADSTNTPCNVIIGPWAINDVYTPICRGSIGKSRNDQVLFCSYEVARTDVWPIDSTPYFDVYLAWSVNGGATWNDRKRLTNYSGPIRDCRYANLAPVNDYDVMYYYANIEYQNDSIPGSAVQGAIESPAQQHFLRVRVLTITSIINGSSGIPEEYVLYQNYPNPFNPATKIKFGVPSASNAKLIVYDVTGREITVLVDKQLEAGNYEVEWNADMYPSGVYFYELRTEKFSLTRKMVLIK